jgi:hypothetical protein
VRWKNGIVETLEQEVEFAKDRGWRKAGGAGCTTVVQRAALIGDRIHARTDIGIPKVLRSVFRLVHFVERFGVYSCMRYIS